MRKLLFWLRMVGYLIVMAVSIAVGLQALGITKPPTGPAMGLIATGAIFTFLASAIACYQQEIGRRRRNQREQIIEIVFNVFRLIAQKTGIDAAELGYGVFELRRRWVSQLVAPRDDDRLISMTPVCRRKVIESIDRVRPMPDPGPTHIRWFEGMGIIGVCMKKINGANADAPAIYTRHPRGITKEQWKQEVSERDRMGMTFEEWERARDGALPVRAFPVYVERKGTKRCRACFAVEAPPGGYEAIMSKDVYDLMAPACTSIRNILYPGK